MLKREELEEAGKPFFAKVAAPVHEALKKAGLTIEDIDLVELVGGGVRVPKITEILEEALNRKDLGVHLNGDEAMCFGSAFIASNSSSSFKVKQMFLTQHPEYDVYLKISPMNAKDALTEDEQKAEGVEEDEIIKYYQQMKLFNTSDYLGKSKGLTMNYNKNMKIELYKMLNGESTEDADLELLDSFNLADLKDQFESEFKYLQNEAERKKKSAEKKKDDNSTEEAKEEAKEEDDGETPRVSPPKAKISIELTRSGYFKIAKANIGAKFLEITHIKKDTQLSDDQIKAAKNRLKWYE